VRDYTGILNSVTFWSRALKWIGGLAMVAGTLDPIEGSVLILAGSGLVALGLYLARTEPRILLDWTPTFILIALGSQRCSA